jgi:hypothetical protein
MAAVGPIPIKYAHNFEHNIIAIPGDKLIHVLMCSSMQIKYLSRNYSIIRFIGPNANCGESDLNVNTLKPRHGTPSYSPPIYI